MYYEKYLAKVESLKPPLELTKIVNLKAELIETILAVVADYDGPFPENYWREHLGSGSTIVTETINGMNKVWLVLEDEDNPGGCYDVEIRELNIYKLLDVLDILEQH